MKDRCLEYDNLILETLRRNRIATDNTPIIYLNIIITFDRSQKPYVDLSDSKEEIIKALKGNKSKSYIKEFRPKRDILLFSSPLNVFFNCIRLNEKKTEDKLYTYVKDNLEIINSNPDIAYYLKETTGIEDIQVDLTKLNGRNDFMSIWTLLQEESEAKGEARGKIIGKEEGLIEGRTQGLTEGKMEERSAIISALLKKLSVAEIAKLLEISEEEVLRSTKSGE